MEITQAISQATPPGKAVPSALAQNTTVISKRELKTFLVIRNNDTAVLGGLAREAETEQVAKVPILGDIPVIGWLFKSNTTTKEKQNLMVFLTPKIIRNPEDQRQTVNNILDERTQYIKDMGGRDPYGRKMDQIRKFKQDANGNVLENGQELDLNSPRQPQSVSAPRKTSVKNESKAPKTQRAPTPAELEDSSLE
jgi:general secretion pathway protein D